MGRGPVGMDQAAVLWSEDLHLGHQSVCGSFLGLDSTFTERKDRKEAVKNLECV